jgi:acyl carrier protein
VPRIGVISVREALIVAEESRAFGIEIPDNDVSRETFGTAGDF